jgi:predicted Zn-dependent protease
VLAISQFMVGNYRGCVDALEPVIGKAELAPQAEYVYADSLVKTGQVASGTERLAALEKAHPEIPDVHRALADAYTAALRPADAQKEMAVYNQLRARVQSDTSTHPVATPQP